MIAEIGQIALILAVIVALFQGIIPLIGAATGQQALMQVGTSGAILQFIVVLIAFLMLTTGYLVSDFSISNVVENSHSLKPLIYKISGVWGNHEGSLVLWALILALFGAAVAGFGGQLPKSLKARVLAIQGLIGVGFLLFILFTSNPFLRIDPAPLDGKGLNPLLQDPGLAFHPPFLYLGYVGLSVTFSFAIAALIEGKIDPAWARWVRPWTLAAWGFLTLGIALGSWWAYYELGWGGWWFWDPVENASFMPWLAATALLHSAIVVEKRDALKSWTVLLAIIAFSLSLLGTFIVRSGVLNSVHAFATDPTRGVYVLAFLVVVIGGSLLLYGIRAPQMKMGGLFAPVSREGALVLNNLFLSAATATVLLGTLYPLFLDALSGQKVTVGGPYFNATFIPIMVPLVVALGVGPLLPWKRADLAGALGRLKVVFVLLLVAVGLLWALVDHLSLMSALGMGLFFWLFGATFFEWAGRVKLFTSSPPKSLQRMKHLPRSAWGMTLAHLGVALVILGITASESWQTERLAIMTPGEQASIGGFVLTFEQAGDIQGPNYTALQGRFTVAKNGAVIETMLPEQRRYQNPPMETTEAAIRPTLAGDLYVVIGEADGKGGYATRLYYKPFISWIWLGSIIMFIGATFSLSDRRFRIAVAKKRARNTSVSSSPEAV